MISDESDALQALILILINGPNISPSIRTSNGFFLSSTLISV
jgi:hypothetical protein